MIALLRSTDGGPDSRFEKYTQFLDDKSIPYVTLCWDRYGVKNPTDNRLYYKRSSKYGLRFKNAFGLLGFNWFLFRKLVSRRKEYKVIHAADFDTILPAMIMKLLFKKKVIYDIYDWYIDSRSIKNRVIKWLVLQLERINVTKSDAVIICEEGRRKQIVFNPKNLWILPNIPCFDIPSKGASKNNDGITISYVGILGSGRGLSNLIKIAEQHPEINFVVGGFGPMEDDFKKASTLPNLDFMGRVAYSDALKIMSASDMIYAMYERVNPNHILAAPNKYYEGLALGTPIITTIGTLVGEKAEKYDTGYCIDEKFESLENLIDEYSWEENLIKGENASTLWQNTYQHYVEHFLTEKYLPFIIEANE